MLLRMVNFMLGVLCNNLNKRSQDPVRQIQRHLPKTGGSRRREHMHLSIFFSCLSYLVIIDKNFATCPVAGVFSEFLGVFPSFLQFWGSFHLQRPFTACLLSGNHCWLLVSSEMIFFSCYFHSTLL